MRGPISVGFSPIPRISRYINDSTVLQVQLNGLPDTASAASSASPEVSSSPETVVSDGTPPTIGIITAKPVEFNACSSMLDRPRWIFVKGRGSGRRYLSGSVPAADGGTHELVLSLLTDQGNNSAASRAARLLAAFPSIQVILMVGIAGGVPCPGDVDKHVRLGDIVVSDRGGVVQYDYIKEMSSFSEARHPPRPPAASLVESIRHLQAEDFMKRRPWEAWLLLLCQRMQVVRPPETSDILASSVDPETLVYHPFDKNRDSRMPKVFTGTIASANRLLKNPQRRDELRDSFGVRAVEMEGSGVADASWEENTGYGVIRGICDYCDHNKNDLWQPYAACAAAAYCRVLLESMPTILV